MTCVNCTYAYIHAVVVAIFLAFALTLLQFIPDSSGESTAE
ncbi:uncharacterized protein RCO7_14916 [Rhynchosporium graminicola]|uniref:Uncharacterized protein n=1 Tax=Rhynchosporium graminicola TaxID=2792576 RepID=A0A1E1LA36_9HELO|nr:uncharacterized protein RCO7_14916 [Rhynchosporium commune]